MRRPVGLSYARFLQGVSLAALAVTGSVHAQTTTSPPGSAGCVETDQWNTIKPLVSQLLRNVESLKNAHNELDARSPAERNQIEFEAGWTRLQNDALEISRSSRDIRSALLKSGISTGRSGLAGESSAVKAFSDKLLGISFSSGKISESASFLRTLDSTLYGFSPEKKVLSDEIHWLNRHASHLRDQQPSIESAFSCNIKKLDRNDLERLVSDQLLRHQENQRLLQNTPRNLTSKASACGTRMPNLSDINAALGSIANSKGITVRMPTKADWTIDEILEVSSGIDEAIQMTRDSLPVLQEGCIPETCSLYRISIERLLDWLQCHKQYRGK